MAAAIRKQNTLVVASLVHTNEKKRFRLIRELREKEATHLNGRLIPPVFIH